MIESRRNAWLKRLDRLWFPVLSCITALAFVYVGSNYRGDAGRFPIIVGLITAALAALEVVARARKSAVADDIAQLSPANLRRGAAISGWVVAMFASFYLVGVIATVAVFGTVYFYFFAGFRIVYSIAAGVGHAAFFYLSFGVLAGFRLFPGVLMQ